MNWTPYFPQHHEKKSGQKQLMRGRTYLVPNLKGIVSRGGAGVEDTMATGGLG